MGARKFIDLTDPKLLSDSKHLNRSPILEDKRKLAESAASKLLLSHFYPGRCNSATLKDDLISKQPKSTRLSAMQPGITRKSKPEESKKNLKH